MTADAVFSDIFTTRAFGDLTNDLKSLFLIQQCNQTCCTVCNNQIVKTTSTIVLYITCPNILPTEFKNCVSKAALPNSSPFFVIHVKGILVMFPLCNIFLPIELSTSFGQTLLPASMEVLGNFYSLKAVVRCASHHFTIAINSGSHWLYYNDMYTAVQQYATFEDVSHAHASGWYFAVYESSLMPSVDDHIHQDNDSCMLMPEHSFSELEDKECQASDDFKKDVYIPRKRQRLEISTNRLTDGEGKLNFNVVNAYMKNYKTAKKAKETESEKLSRQQKQKEYMRRYRRRIKDNETEEEKQARLKKHNVQIRKCRQNRQDNKLNEKPVRKFTTWQIVDKSLHNVDKETYLSQFDSIKSDPIDVQK